MIDFLIKSTISLSLLLGVYYLFLEREKMHTFNRFYLLFSLLFSFAIPFITIEIAVESIAEALILPNPIQTIQTVQTQNGAVPLIEKEEFSYIPILLWSLYALITVLLAVRFGKNIGMIVSKVRKNRTVAHANSTLVLTKEKALPHTFLQYIFINEEDFDNRNIQEELYTHELTHVRQKHSYDILFIEVLKTVFWFNPILLFYKKAIQLNHEFLADEKVVKSYNNVPFYQNLLLEKASWNSNFYLASNLNFSVTKKRLIMMTKTTSRSRALLTKLSVLPILAGLIFFSCSETDSKNDKAAEAKTSEIKTAEVKTAEVETAVVKTEEPIFKQDLAGFLAMKTEDRPSAPEFPGGIAAFYEFSKKEFSMPAGFKGKGNVIASFIVETDGSLSDIKILRDLGHGTGEEVVRILKKSPKWEPGILKGKAIRSQYNLPIRIEYK